MKIILASLMCFVLGASECFAIKGGPWGGKGRVSVTGTYAGILVPIAGTVSPPIEPPPPVEADNSLALFTVTVPRQGIATGVSVVFRNGFFYPGIINAVADPDRAQMSGVMNATFAKTFTRNDENGVAHDYTFNFNANGGFSNVKVVANQQFSGFTSIRLQGTASLTYTTENDPNNTDFSAGDSGGPLQYTVVGFKQAELSQ